MPTAEQASAWLALMAGLVCAAIGGLSIVRPQSVPQLRKTKWDSADSRRFGQGQLSMAAFFWLNAVPRLADASRIVVLVLSLPALISLIVAVRMLVQTKPPEDPHADTHVQP